MFSGMIAALWPLVWHFGIIYGVMIVALLYAYVSQMFLAGLFRNTALFIALGAFIIGATAATYTRLGENYVLAKWDAAEKAAIARGEKAHNDAVDFVNSSPDGVRGDPANRD
jgi:hypothetical protein